MYQRWVCFWYILGDFSPKSGAPLLRREEPARQRATTGLDKPDIGAFSKTKGLPREQQFPILFFVA